MAAYMRQVCRVLGGKLSDCSRNVAYRGDAFQLASFSRGVSHLRSLHLSSSYQKKDEKKDEKSAVADESEEKAKDDELKKRPIVDVQTSIRYLNSKAYKITYGGALVWEPYRRNHKGSIPPEKTRRTCIRKGVVSTGNPCPICRDEYLVLHPENVQLLKQFISPHTGHVLSYQKTGVCQVQHKKLLVVVEQAWDLGYIDKPIPFRKYDYEDYYPQINSSEEKAEA